MSLMSNPYADPELQKVLTRKYQIANLTWGDTDVYGTSLGTVDPMSALLNIQNIADKLTQFRWLRADVDIEIRINATPFHIGALMVSYIPRTTDEATDPALLWPSKNASLTQKSQNHGMVMSASSMNNMTIAIKREAPIIFDPIDEVGVFAGCLGTLDFSVLNPLVLASGGSASPLNISVFASFSNPKVSGYGYFPILNPPRKVVPHSKDVATEAISRAAGAIIGPEATKLFSPSVVTGPIDTFKSLIESVAPVAQFAMSMGLSKPTNETTVHPVINDEFRDLNYGHGVAQATKFSFHPSAGLGEANMSFLKKNKIKDFIMKPAYLTSRILTKTDPADTPLMLLPIHPSLSNYESGIFSPTPLSYASQVFAYWRGGMKLRFEFITSQFVTARVRITHWPAPTLPSSIEEFAGDAVSAIVDIRGDTPFDFTIPYVSPFPYQPTHGYLHADNSAGYSQLPLQEQNSFVTLSLINSVQQPDFDGNGVIYVNVYVSAAEDFVFGGLVRPVVRTPLATLPMPPSHPQVEPHSLDVAFSKGFKPFIPATTSYEAGMVLPEQFTGVEEVCMRPSILTTTVGAISVNDIQPLVSQNDLQSGLVNYAEDMVSFWAPCFRWNRGAVRYKLVYTTSSVDADRFSNISFNRVVPEDGDQQAAVMWTDHNLRSITEFELPWVLPTFMNSFWDAIAQDRIVNTSPYNTSLNTTGAAALVGMYRSLGDDFVFGHQLAMPTFPFVLPVSSSRASLETPNLTSVAKPRNEPARLDQSLALPDDIKERLKEFFKKNTSMPGPTSSQ